jgi:hypothetical protein
MVGIIVRSPEEIMGDEGGLAV